MGLTEFASRIPWLRFAWWARKGQLRETDTSGNKDSRAGPRRRAFHRLTLGGLQPLTATGPSRERRTAHRSPHLRKPRLSRHETKRVRGPVPPTTCATEVALIGDYLASRLSSRVLNAFEKHLKDCPDCASFLRTYKKTIEVTRSFLRLESAKCRPPHLVYRQLGSANSSNC